MTDQPTSKPSRASRFKMPDTLVLLFGIMIMALIATWLLPQGEFAREADEAGRVVVVPGTYTQLEETETVTLSPWSLLTAVPRALGDAQVIIFFLFIVGGTIAVLRGTGMIDAVLGTVLRRVGHSPIALISLGILIFTAGSSLLGASLEYIPFAGILVALCLAMRMDAMTAMGIMIVGYGVGYGAAIMNPYTVMVAQPIADLELLSGTWYRVLWTLPFLAIGIHHVWAYSRRVQLDPSRSLMLGVQDLDQPVETDYPALTGRRLTVALLTVAALAVIVLGISTFGWYLIEVGAVWLGLAIVAGFVGGMDLNESAKRFGKGASELTVAALLVGFARAISLLLEDGQVLDTLVHGLSIPLQNLGPEIASVGMLLLQTMLNLFIPSGSGQAFVAMPIMAPLADTLEVTRQVAVLAFQYGDGFANILFPTNVVLMAILGLGGVPYDRWVRFAGPLLLKLLAAAAIALVIAVRIGYS